MVFRALHTYAFMKHKTTLYARMKHISLLSSTNILLSLTLGFLCARFAMLGEAHAMLLVSAIPDRSLCFKDLVRIRSSLWRDPLTIGEDTKGKSCAAIMRATTSKHGTIIR